MKFIRWNRNLRATALLILSLGSAAVLAAQAVSIPEEIEWTWAARPPHADAKLPNVLLIGDSITRNYYPQVTRDLAGIANVYLFAASTCVGDPRLPHQIAEFAAMEHVQFTVVHFNNGMHGWAYTEAQYKQAFPEFLRALRQTFGQDAAFVWASSTPIRSQTPEGATNARVEARNAIADVFIKAQGIPTDDQHQLMLNHLDLLEDLVHFNPAGAAIQGDQAAKYIRGALAH